MRQIEQSLFDQGIEYIAGVDEAGRGPWAGPVVAAAVIIPKDYEFKNKITDSKKLSLNQREKAYDEIISECWYAFFIVSEKEIDRLNILQASLLAMEKSLTELAKLKIPQWVIVDGPHKPKTDISCDAVIDGDAKSISIASASIIAKVTRDRLMLEYDRLYPEYGFAAHKGYGTKVHKEALEKFGPCPIHRRSFSPIKNILSSIWKKT